MEIKKIAVVGAGLMGSGIAQVAAQSGFDVSLQDVSREMLDKALGRIADSLKRLEKAGRITPEGADTAMNRLDITDELEAAVAGCGLIIEAVPEKLELKQKIFSDLDHLAAPGAVLASNTSELSITAIAAATKRPESVIGMHWFNPPAMMRLIEIVTGVDTAQATVDIIVRVSEQMGKETVLVKDCQGFVTSRVLAAHMLECMRVLEEGVAAPEDIDKAVRLGLNYPMGPFQLADYVGLDTLLFAAQGLVEAYGDRFRPPQILTKLVQAGHLGKKTGRGFYEY